MITRCTFFWKGYEPSPDKDKAIIEETARINFPEFHYVIQEQLSRGNRAGYMDTRPRSEPSPE